MALTDGCRGGGGGRGSIFYSLGVISTRVASRQHRNKVNGKPIGRGFTEMKCMLMGTNVVGENL